MELLVVLSMMGILASVAAARFGPGVLGDVGAQSQGRRLSLDLLRAQRASIMTGDSHYLNFTVAEGRALGYQLFRRLEGGGVEAVDDYYPFSDRVTVTVSDTQFEFDFHGEAMAAYQATLAGAQRTYQLTVVPITGASRLVEL